MEEEEGGRGGYARLLRGVRGPHGGDDSQTNASSETSTWEPENKFISTIFKECPAPYEFIFASGNLISLDRTGKRFLDFSISNEVSLKVRRI